MNEGPRELDHENMPRRLRKTSMNLRGSGTLIDPQALNPTDMSTQEQPLPPRRVEGHLWAWSLRVAIVFLFVQGFPFPLDALIAYPLDFALGVLDLLGLEFAKGMPSIAHSASMLSHQVQGVLAGGLASAFGWAEDPTPTGSSDTVLGYMWVLCSLMVALIVGSIWQFARPQGVRDTTWKWAHLVLRLSLALSMLYYGADKIYNSQFGDPGLSTLDRRVGDLFPAGMVWAFHGLSDPYEKFLGFCELLVGLLLLHRRASMVGALGMVGVMTNVVAINLCYDVPVKRGAITLLVGALAALLPYRRRIWGLIAAQELVKEVDLKVWPRKMKATSWRRLCAAFVAICLISMHLSFMRSSRQINEWRKKPDLYGIWDVESIRKDGISIPAYHRDAWRTLIIDRNSKCSLLSYFKKPLALRCRVDLEGATLELAVPEADKNAPAQRWQIDLRKSQQEMPDPAPKSMKDYKKKVQVEVPALGLQGELGDSTYEIHVKQRKFPLHQGFRWIQRAPRW